mgnify:CR=1 FL=1
MYVDKSAIQANRDTYYFLSKRGGLTKPCGTYLGYNLISNDTNICDFNKCKFLSFSL